MFKTKKIQVLTQHRLIIKNKVMQIIMIMLYIAGMMEFPDVQYNPQGYLFLASEQSSQVVKDNYEIQWYILS